MSMILTLRRADAADIAALAADPDLVDDLFDLKAEESRVQSEALMDLDKAWHMIHFLLTQSPWSETLPQGFLLGGRTVGEDLGYGPARVLTPAQIQAVARFLAELPDDHIERWFDAAAMRGAEIYALSPDAETDEDIEYAADYFASLRHFVAKAAEADQGLVIAML